MKVSKNQEATISLTSKILIQSCKLHKIEEIIQAHSELLLHISDGTNEADQQCHFMKFLTAVLIYINHV